MVETATVPILHIADAVIADLAGRDGATGAAGLLATAATLRAGFYQERLAAAGYACVESAAEVMATCVLPAIALVKRNRAEAAPLVMRAVSHLEEAGVETVVRACTELPIALAARGRSARLSRCHLVPGPRVHRVASRPSLRSV